MDRMRLTEDVYLEVEANDAVHKYKQTFGDISPIIQFVNDALVTYSLTDKFAVWIHFTVCEVNLATGTVSGLASALDIKLGLNLMMQEFVAMK